MFARHFIDSLDFAHNGRELRDEVAVAKLPRLQDMLASPTGNIDYVVRGLQGKDGRPMLELEMNGSCQLRCQRCLGSLDYPIELTTRLLLAPGSELDEFSDNESELDSIAADKHLDVLDMVEEELLLTLPFAPKHPEGACAAVAEGLNRPEGNPFAALAGLKKSVF
ncbi:MAG: DUF177 domain-containing protein [Nitrosomonadales bacterium]|nr:DUF177 domain-containing protein [Nitrosomonadales bacterium]